MKVRQSAHLEIYSAELSPEEMTEALGIPPDESALKGSRKVGRNWWPVEGRWILNSGLPKTVDLNDHLDALFARATPILPAVQALLASERATGGFYIHRDFEPGPEDEAVLEVRTSHLPPGLSLLRGQHPLLGFALDPSRVAVLAQFGLGIEITETGDEFE